MVELTNLADPRNKSEVGSGTGPSTSGSKDEGTVTKMRTTTESCLKISELPRFPAAGAPASGS